MRFAAAEPGDDAGLFEVTAMVDVVFILLAFFVLTARFTGGERELGLGVAEAPATETSGLEPGDLPTQLVVRARASGGGGVGLSLGGRPLPDGGFAELTDLLRELDLPGVPVVVAADPALTVQQVATTLDAALAGPGGAVSLARLGAAPPEPEAPGE